MTDETTKVTPNDPYGFSKMNSTELRKVIADETKSIQEVEENKKAFVGAVNDTIKEGKTRVKNAVEFLRASEAAGTDLAHEKAVVSFLKTATNQGS